MVPLKQYHTQLTISLKILEQCSSNLAPETNILEEGKWHPSCCCHDNSYAAGPVLIKTKLPRFHLKQRSSTPNNLMGIVKTVWEPCVFGVRHCPALKGWKWGCLVFHRKRMGPRVLPWQQLRRCHSLPFVMHIWRTLLQYFWRYCWLSVPTVLMDHLWRHHFPHLHNTKT